MKSPFLQNLDELPGPVWLFGAYGVSRMWSWLLAWAASGSLPTTWTAAVTLLASLLPLTLLWLLLNVVGVFDQVTQIVSSTGLDAGGFDLANVLSLSTVLSAVTIFSIIEVVLFTVLVVILTLLYNVVSTLVGGIHVTLGDD